MEKATAIKQRGVNMAFDKNKYDIQWKKERRDEFKLRVPKGNKELLVKMAAKYGKNGARFIKDALYYYMDALGEERINLE